MNTRGGCCAPKNFFSIYFYTIVSCPDYLYALIRGIYGGVIAIRNHGDRAWQNKHGGPKSDNWKGSGFGGGGWAIRGNYNFTVASLLHRFSLPTP